MEGLIFGIYGMFKTTFLRKMSSALELSSFISASLKSFVTVELAAQNAGQISL